MTAISCICNDCRVCRHREASRRYHGRLRDERLALRERRLPIAPLLAIANAAQFRSVATQIYRWEKRGWLTETWADRLALRAGYHPCEIWSDWFAGVGT